MAKVFLHSNEVTLNLKGRRKLKQFIVDIFKKEKKFLSQLDFVFCTDEYLLQINRDSLQHDYYTDIITFDISNSPNEIIGEVYISLDRVKDNATNYKVTLKDELHRVLFHGVLHLCGYKDKLKNDIALMRKKENHYLELYFK